MFEVFVWLICEVLSVMKFAFIVDGVDDALSKDVLDFWFFV